MPISFKSSPVTSRGGRTCFRRRFRQELTHEVVGVEIAVAGQAIQAVQFEVLLKMWAGGRIA